MRTNRDLIRRTRNAVNTTKQHADREHTKTPSGQAMGHAKFAPEPRARMIGAAVLGVVATMVITGCVASTPTETPDAPVEPVAGGTLVYASGDAEPVCLDPHVGGNYPQALISTQYLEALVSRNVDGEIIPWLAESWTESDDGLSWEFTLRDDVIFTDGTPFNAEAVIANIEHLQDPETASSTGYLAVAKVTEVTAPSEFVAKFELTAPDSALLESLSQQWVAIQSPAGIERGMEENCAAPIGTGPFIVQDWAVQDSVTLVRNEHYNSAPQDSSNQGTAYLEEVIWRFIPDATTRQAALESGEVHIIDNPQPDKIAATDGTSIVHIPAPRPGSVNRIELNSGKAPFDDQQVRRAVLLAADVDPGIESIFFGAAQRSYSLLSSIEPLGLSSPERFDTDPDEAARLLDQAGWDETDAEGYRVKDGQRLTLDFPVSTNQSVPAEQALFEQIQANLKTVGIEVRIELLDLSSWYAALAANEYELVSAPYTKVGPDVLRILYHSDGIVPAPSGYFANHAQVNDPAVDAALTAASQTGDPAERERLFSEAQELILAGEYVLPLYDQQNHYLVSSDVVGVRPLPTVSTPWLQEAFLTE